MSHQGEIDLVRACGGRVQNVNFEGTPGTSYGLGLKNATGKVRNAVGATYRATITWTSEGPAESLPANAETPDEPYHHEFWVGDEKDRLLVPDSLLMSFSENL